MRVIKWEPFRDVDDIFDRFLPRPCAAGRASVPRSGRCSTGRRPPT